MTSTYENKMIEYINSNKEPNLNDKLLYILKCFTYNKFLKNKEKKIFNSYKIYQKDGYVNINDCLNHNDCSEETKADIHNLSLLIDNAPITTHVMKLYRGIKYDPNLKIGDYLYNKHFLSTSLSENVAINFLRYYCCMLVIYVPPYHNCYNSLDFEHEILLQKDLLFKLFDIKNDKSYPEYHLLCMNPLKKSDTKTIVESIIDSKNIKHEINIPNDLYEYQYTQNDINIIETPTYLNYTKITDIETLFDIIVDIYIDIDYKINQNFKNQFFSNKVYKSHLKTILDMYIILDEYNRMLYILNISNMTIILSDISTLLKKERRKVI